MKKVVQKKLLEYITKEGKSSSIEKISKEPESEPGQKDVEEEMMYDVEVSLSEGEETNQEIISGILLSVGYDGAKGCAYAKLYNPESKRLFKWYDLKRTHKPYLLTDLSKEELEEISDVKNHKGLVGMEEVEKYDLLRDKKVIMTKVIADDPLSIGGKSNSLRELLPSDRWGARAWEARIRYHHCFTYDNNLIPGMLYIEKDNKLQLVDVKISKKVRDHLFNLLKSGETGYEDILERYLPIFLYPVPHIDRVAIDIEVFTPELDRIPDSKEAEYDIISAAFASTDGLNKVLVLKRANLESSKEESSLPSNVEVIYFEDEKELIKEIFSIINKYPIVVTFNGDNFDLRYLYHRAEKLGFKKEEIPIELTKDEAHLKYGVHIDLYKFFHNNAIKVYAFGNAYKEVTLDTIAKALLGVSKIEIEKPISELSLEELAHYNYQDAKITLDLTTFNDNLALKLIVLLMRISRLPMEDLVRQGVSSWVKSLFYAEHRIRNYLIPRPEEITGLKGDVDTSPIIKGKKYKGAIVVEPKPGVHFNVVVLDFACHPEGTMVIVKEKGEVDISEVKEGDYVLGIDGWHKVKKVHVYPYRGYLIDVNGLLCTSNHKIPIYYNNRGLSDRLAKTLANGVVKSGFVIRNPIKYNCRDENSELWLLSEFAGIMLAEGNLVRKDIRYWSNERECYRISKQYRIEISIGLDEKELLDRILEISKKLWNYKPYVRKEKGKNGYRITFSRKKIYMDVVNFLGNLENRSIPEAILRGFFEGDGSINIKKRIIQVNQSIISEETIKIISKLLDKVGIKYCLWKGRPPSYKDTSRKGLFQLSIYGRKNLINFLVNIGFISRRKRDLLHKIINERKIRAKDNYILEKPKTTLKYYEGYVYDLTLEGKPYYFANGILSHNSLYPSVIKKYNLSYETVRCVHPECRDQKVPETNHWVCKKRRGITSQIIGFLRDIRVKWFKPMSKDKNLPQEIRNWYSVVQQALKVLINASYGVFAAEHFPFFCLPVAESTASIGRYAITKTIEKAKELGVEVVYGDTDSVFLKEPSEEKIEELIRWSSEELGIELDVDKVYRYLALSRRKKNYLGVFSDGSVDIKGLTGKKRNTPIFLQRAFMEVVKVLGEVKSVEDFENAKKKIRDIAQECYRKLEEKRYSLEELAFKVQLTKPLKHYVKTTPQHVKAARMLKAQGKEIKPGDIITFVKTRGVPGVKPVQYASIYEIDVEKYKDHIRTTFEQILDALGIDFSEIMGIRSLDTFI